MPVQPLVASSPEVFRLLHYAHKKPRRSLRTRLTSGSPGLAGYIVGLFPGCEGGRVNISPPWWLILQATLIAEGVACETTW